MRKWEDEMFNSLKWCAINTSTWDDSALIHKARKCEEIEKRKREMSRTESIRIESNKFPYLCSALFHLWKSNPRRLPSFKKTWGVLRLRMHWNFIFPLFICALFFSALVSGNVFVIAAILLEKNLQSVANYLILSLAVADLLVACLVMPLSAVYEISREWKLGPELCDMWTSSDVLCCTASILHLVAIALDR